jgi:hypothetical protein
MQPIGKHVTAATNTNIIIKLLLETVFSILPVQNSYKKENWNAPVSCQLRESSPREAVKIGLERGKLKNLHC